MISTLFPPMDPITIPIHNNSCEFPVHRVYCVGKNYADHIREMGGEGTREDICFFMKPTDALTLKTHMPYPQATKNLHFEAELVLALGKGGKNIEVDSALEHIFGYALGLDMTRRDLQTASGRRGLPWDTGKAFDYSAPISKLWPRELVGDLKTERLLLWRNGELCQDASLSQLLWTIPEIIAELSKLYALKPGDLIFTGTPAGVGPVVPGDKLMMQIEKLGELDLTIVSEP
jgi:fumarylpyruvate hydrolase